MMLGTLKIREVFARLRQTHRKALIPFVMAGDPSLPATAQLIQALAGVGADCVEVGIPFSDPLADGPTIQRASSRALGTGVTPAAVLKMIARIKRRVAVPLILLSYWNPVVHYGSRRAACDPAPFLRDAARCGVSGLIVPDLPPDEADGLHDLGRRHGIATIFLAAPTSPAYRLRRIARASEGFIYYVSLTGTTGARRQLPPDWLHGVRELKLLTTKPVCVGFGISTPAHARAVGRVADGVIVGSALLNALEPFRNQRRRWLREAAAFLRGLRRAV
ncbi:MAG TPA: tryptophan synthase subunit alpha [Candidatus Omnitrophica bacterium]|nr:tryptophan synthase subunit alpha [Candidatus Omnitrophota bacterium]HBH97403.1 tryptophan synthase subunit alpha [Candidatus Omnitrophota bacterium]HBQ38898.1 tryptophan synthase subunit alpha [Candidatus Omnitrophota bacterium]